MKVYQNTHSRQGCKGRYLLFVSLFTLIMSCQPDDEYLIAEPSAKLGITDLSLRIDMQANNNHVTWQDTVMLNGLVFVDSGEELTILAGTIIKGLEQKAGLPGSSLIIARGGRINAVGTKEAPIIFTYEGDPLDGSTQANTRGRWGGLIILGHAKLNCIPGESTIEGIPTSERRARYGGEDDNDNSGTVRYVSIRHGGTDIGAGDEINGLTLGGVGSRTTLEYIEIFANKDDGVEFFGGRANVRYLISAYNQDDAIDYDKGFRGFCQYVIVYQDATNGAADRGFECDGGSRPETAMPYAIPMFVNVTAVGNKNSRAATFRDNAGGYFFNAIFKGFGKGIDIEDTSEEQDSWQHMQNDRLVFRHNLFALNGTKSLDEAYQITTDNTSSPHKGLLDKVRGKANKADASIEFKPGSVLPNTADDVALAYIVPQSMLDNYPNNKYQASPYIGAIDPTADTEWYATWTKWSLN